MGIKVNGKEGEEAIDEVNSDRPINDLTLQLENPHSDEEPRLEPFSFAPDSNMTL